MTTPVYPNPNRGVFTINNRHNDTQLEIFNAVGARVDVARLASAAQRVDELHLPSGLYLVQATGNGRERVDKMVIEK